ncbi:uncharacterized protein LOC126409786 isoform X2 [Nymphaea colorata]|uniref:uncharacterized protein LOC126409786 isoform X2 n=1 Tax=Nymphaea colorata TaxID=210225 RepID=UPI00214E0DE9|nr:uncharacterized protein LOC126409786 isoform X2 [Nymphaea colorata]
MVPWIILLFTMRQQLPSSSPPQCSSMSPPPPPLEHFSAVAKPQLLGSSSCITRRTAIHINSWEAVSQYFNGCLSRWHLHNNRLLFCDFFPAMKKEEKSAGMTSFLQ